MLSVQAQLKEGERLFDFLDDKYNIHQSKAGIKPSMTDAATKPEAVGEEIGR